MLRLISNSGSDRTSEALKKLIPKKGVLELASTKLSLFAFEELRNSLAGLSSAKILLSSLHRDSLEITGNKDDIFARNRLESHRIAADLTRWLKDKAHVRVAPSFGMPMFSIRNEAGSPIANIHGVCAFSTDGLGLSGIPHQAMAVSDPTMAESYASMFDSAWQMAPDSASAKDALLSALADITTPKSAELIYFHILSELLGTTGELDEAAVINPGTGFFDSLVWKKLFKFQRDGVIGAIDKLSKFGGCILADSVGLGKTFEALAVIKYYELRNLRVLVLCPKRLRGNWTLYRANDRRNSLSADNLRYDVLNHTDLTRSTGKSGDIDLRHFNWANYDLVVIDESHNFRNAGKRNREESRYGKLMTAITKGTKTKVLMLSATPVNNRLADLRNQLFLALHGEDEALAEHGITSLQETLRQAQTKFNRWQDLPDADRTPARLVDDLGFDYFKLLDLMSIARSRAHIERYYGTEETGKFPLRLAPINRRIPVRNERAAKTDAASYSLLWVDEQIRSLKLAIHSPLKYVLEDKKAEYESRYSVKVRNAATFRQADREQSNVALQRANLLKRMESSVHAFTLTLNRTRAQVAAMLAQIDEYERCRPAKAELEASEPLPEEEEESETPASMEIGKRVVVDLADIDRSALRQDLQDDLTLLDSLLSGAITIGPGQDAKLADLRSLISAKVTSPLNPGNRKILVFTAAADTAQYLYEQLAHWALKEHGLRTAVVTGSRNPNTNLAGLPDKSLGSILTAFSPRSKERPAEDAAAGDIDLLIATDCISEGQNLQDCDYLVNYDIHWNPVRIIQRFGRVDRIGSINERIQLVNYWPDLDLDDYINLEARVTSRMKLLVTSATGEDDIIDESPDGGMNDLEYRRRQLKQLQEKVVDLEEMGTGVSITDFTLNDFRVALADFRKAHPGTLSKLFPGAFAAVFPPAEAAESTPPGVIFCLRAETPAVRKATDPTYPLAPHYLVHIGFDGATLLPYPRAKQILDRLRKIAVGRSAPDTEALAAFDKITRSGADMREPRRLLDLAVTAILGRSEERVVDQLFSPHATSAAPGGDHGVNDFEVVAFLVIPPRDA